MKRPVTNEEFLAFVRSHPRWRRDRVAAVFADASYLARWPAPSRLANDAQGAQPVTQVSYYAATAYCAAQRARLPRWIEWEYVAAADETRKDARRDARWRERILAWYARPSTHALPRAGAQLPNAYGVQDLHGVVWEWTEDYSALLVVSDNRVQGDADRNRFCGAGALSMDDRENYAVLMRVAMLSSLGGSDTTMNLGFRCVREVR
jgi:formylglycine-generating enzyme required for sulfatase activity